MSDPTKVKLTHTHRAAVIYVRQSSTAQVEHNRESTERQYALVHRAIDLGWHRDQVMIIDDDLGVSGSGITKRPASPGWLPTSPWPKLASSSASRCPAWPAITPTGTARSICVG
jgi:hypothetical protein